jgi:hypothetical protein
LKFFLIVLISLCFLGGLFAFLPNGDSLLKITLFFIITIYFLIYKTSISKKSYFIIFPFLLHTIYSFISSLIYFNSTLKALLAVQPYILCIMLYFFLCALPLYKYINLNTNLFKIIITIQVIFCFFKISFIGVSESTFIGTMSQGAGQLSFLIPCICIPLVLLKYSNRLYMCIIILSFVFLIAIAGEKRASIYVFPLLVIFIYPFILYDSTKFKKILKILYITIFLIIFIFCGVISIPSLSSENGADGFSLTFIMQYAIDYLFMDYGGNLQKSYEVAKYDHNVQVGRFTLWLSILNYIINQDFTSILFGMGHGSFTPSKWINSTTDLLFINIGTRGAFTGANQVLLENGVIGFLIIFLFFINIFYKIFKQFLKYKFRSYRNSIFIIFCIHSVCFADFLFYSSLLFKTLPMPFIYFCTIYYLVNIKPEFIIKKLYNHDCSKYN